MAVAGEHPHQLAVALDDQAVAAVLDFVDPVGPAKYRRGASGCTVRTGICACGLDESAAANCEPGR
jgi:hypothetical protein